MAGNRRQVAMAAHLRAGARRSRSRDVKGDPLDEPGQNLTVGFGTVQMTVFVERADADPVILDAQVDQQQ